jgi:uncharacterized membrane protein
MTKETHKRSIVKAVSWRIFGLVFTFTIAWLVTGSVKAGVTLGLIDFFVKIGTFYAHERVWQKIDWGREKHNMPDIGGGI